MLPCYGDAPLEVGTPSNDPAAWLIDIGSFYDRFGDARMAVLQSQDVIVMAVREDVASRKWIDLRRADVAASIDAIIERNIPGVTVALKEAILTTPVEPMENLALRKLYFT